MDKIYDKLSDGKKYSIGREILTLLSEWGYKDIDMSKERWDFLVKSNESPTNVHLDIENFKDANNFYNWVLKNEKLQLFYEDVNAIHIPDSKQNLIILWRDLFMEKERQDIEDLSGRIATALKGALKIEDQDKYNQRLLVVKEELRKVGSSVNLTRIGDNGPSSPGETDELKKEIEKLNGQIERLEKIIKDKDILIEKTRRGHANLSEKITRKDRDIKSQKTQLSTNAKWKKNAREVLSKITKALRTQDSISKRDLEKILTDFKS